MVTRCYIFGVFAAITKGIGYFTHFHAIIIA